MVKTDSWCPCILGDKALVRELGLDCQLFLASKRFWTVSDKVYNMVVMASIFWCKTWNSLSCCSVVLDKALYFSVRATTDRVSVMVTEIGSNTNWYDSNRFNGVRNGLNWKKGRQRREKRKERQNNVNSYLNTFYNILPSHISTTPLTNYLTPWPNQLTAHNSNPAQLH